MIMPKLSKSTQLMRAKKLLRDFAEAEGDRKKIAKKRNTTPANIGRQLRKPYIREVIEKTMIQQLDEQGVTDKFIAKKVRRLMDAETPYGKTFIPDNGAQLRATELSLRVKKHLTDNKTEINILNVGISTAIKQGRERLENNNIKIIEADQSS